MQNNKLKLAPSSRNPNLKTDFSASIIYIIKKIIPPIRMIARKQISGEVSPGMGNTIFWLQKRFEAKTETSVDIRSQNSL